MTPSLLILCSVVFPAGALQALGKIGTVSGGHRTACDAIFTKADGTVVCGPQVIIGGAMKCGTNTLGTLIEHHERVKVNTCGEGKGPGSCDACGGSCVEMYQGGSDNRSFWEQDFFTFQTITQNYGHPEIDYQDERALERYAQQVGGTDGVHNITWDKSPSYFNVHLFPDVPNHAKTLLPHAKVIFTLCDPAKRLYSEYKHILHARDENTGLYSAFDRAGFPRPENFNEWVDVLQGNSRFCTSAPEQCSALKSRYLLKGAYADLLKPWMDSFGADSVLIVDMETTRAQPEDITKRILAHLGLSEDEYPWEELKEGLPHEYANPTYGGRDEADVEAPAAMEFLRNFYKPYNEKLADLVDQSYPLNW